MLPRPSLGPWGGSRPCPWAPGSRQSQGPSLQLRPEEAGLEDAETNSIFCSSVVGGLPRPTGSPSRAISDRAARPLFPGAEAKTPQSPRVLSPSSCSGKGGCEQVERKRRHHPAQTPGCQCRQRGAPGEGGGLSPGAPGQKPPWTTIPIPVLFWGIRWGAWKAVDSGMSSVRHGEARIWGFCGSRSSVPVIPKLSELVPFPPPEQAPDSCPLLPSPTPPRVCVGHVSWPGRCGPFLLCEAALAQGSWELGLKKPETWLRRRGASRACVIRGQGQLPLRWGHWPGPGKPSSQMRGPGAARGS